MPLPFAVPVAPAPEQLQQLQALERASSTPQALAFRARLVLRAAEPDQPPNYRIAQEFGCSRNTVALWRQRFHDHGLPGLQDAPRSGRPRAFSP